MKEFRILVPVDFSDGSAVALETALAFAENRMPSEIWLLHVDPGLVPFYDEELGVLEPTEFSHRLRLRTLQQPFQTDVPFHEEFVHGEPVEEILKLAEELQVDLIVMGTHGRTGMERLLVGSVTEAVLREATCPVLCVKNQPPERRSSEMDQRKGVSTEFNS